MSEIMDQVEARRRFEKILVLSGYSMSGLWTKKYHDQDDKENVYSMTLKQKGSTLDAVRAVLWVEKGEWSGMISVEVGEDGEFPLTGGRILRREKQLWTLKPHHLLLPRIEEVLQQVKRWDKEWAAPLADKAMMKLSISYLREGKPKKAVSILLGALRGEVSMATISESLSIIQSKWSRSREERLRSALIWSQIFR